ncbi:flavodoxin family protein [Paradesulfitobacterium aromaticivorans]
MELSVLGLACSPRRHGNTTILLHHAMEHVKALGHKGETVFVADLNFSQCEGCGACSAKGVCKFKDDIQVLSERLLAVDRLIIAAPIFFMGVNAQTKAMVDRMQPFWAKKYLLQEPIIEDPTRLLRRGLFISAAGTKREDVFACAEHTVRTLFNMLEIKYAGGCLYKGVDQAGEIKEHPTAFAEVEQAVAELLS